MAATLPNDVSLNLVLGELNLVTSAAVSTVDANINLVLGDDGEVIDTIISSVDTDVFLNISLEDSVADMVVDSVDAIVQNVTTPVILSIDPVKGDPGPPGGPSGPIGPPGLTGPQGVNSFTTTALSVFTVPVVGSTTTVTVADASWIIVGQLLYFDTAGGGTGHAGALLVTAKAGNVLTLLNPTPPPAVGAIQGPQGPPGTRGSLFLGGYPTLANLPVIDGIGVAVGDYALVNDTSTMYQVQ
jgi:hypothetical protein